MVLKVSKDQLPEIFWCEDMSCGQHIVLVDEGSSAEESVASGRVHFVQGGLQRERSMDNIRDSFCVNI